MRIQIVLMLLGITFVLDSCLFSGCKKIPFSSDELEWYYSLPNLNDTILFLGSDSTVDTFVVTNNFKEFGRCNRLEKGEFQYDEFRCSASLVNKNKTKCSGNKFDIHFMKEDSTLAATYQYVQVFDIYFEGNRFAEKFTTESIYLIQLKKRIETIKVEESVNTNRENLGCSRILNFNWSKDHGLIRYMKMDSTIFEFWRKY